MKCPCCKTDEDLGNGNKRYLFKRITFTTDWGFEDFLKCLACGIILQETEDEGNNFDPSKQKEATP